ncbi:rod shape-determining protein MreD [Lysobacteraceae bacterium NML08-0793]|nr:rod shape-determining protein MreD [Xanthomonadaceae bacterium NML08-0793]
MSRERPVWPLMLISVLLAVVAMLIPLPAQISPLRPYWLALVVVYWGLEAPDKAGLGFAFFAGLLADFAYGTLLGEQALRMVMLLFLVDRFRSRLRFFPIWQQALVVGAMLLNDRIVAATVHAFAGAPQWPPAYWLSPISGLLMWGPLFLVLDALRYRRRQG